MVAVGACEAREVGLAVRDAACPHVEPEQAVECLRAVHRASIDRLLEGADGAVGYAGHLVDVGEVVEAHRDRLLVVAREDAEGVEAEETRSADERGSGGDARPVAVPEARTPDARACGRAPPRTRTVTRRAVRAGDRHAPRPPRGSRPPRNADCCARTAARHRRPTDSWDCCRCRSSDPPATW